MKLISGFFLTIVVALPMVAIGQKHTQEVKYAMEHGAEARICLKVNDDTGAPVSNANIRVTFDMQPTPQSVYGRTGANGVCVVDGKTNGNRVDFLVKAIGFYDSRTTMTFVQMGSEHQVKDGKWCPYGEEVSIGLRKIRNPTKLAVSFMREFNDTKEINTWIGYDLNKRDFVRPYGEGDISDFEVYFDWDGRCFSDYRGMAIRIRFVDKFAGYYQSAAYTTSDFKWPYSAETNAAYAQSADFSEHVIIEDAAYGKKYERRFFEGDKCWILRSRCRIDDKGSLVSANYSVIDNIEFCYSRGGVAGICICGAFNPTPNDTNLEDIEITKRSRAFIRQCEPPPNP